MIQTDHSKDNLYLAIAVFCAIALLALAGFIGYGRYRTRNYMAVNAQILDVRKALHYSGTGSQTKSWHMTCSYQYDGKSYECNLRTLLHWFRKEGRTVKLYVNPDNPDMVRELYPEEAGLLLGGFLLVFLIVMILSRLHII